MSSAATPPPLSGSAPQEKAASRNKQKYRVEPPSAELDPFSLEYSLTADCVGFEFLSHEKAAMAVAACEDVNLDIIPTA